MIVVYPDKRRTPLMRVIVWLPLLLQTWWLHPSNGLGYATYWANRNLRPEPAKP